MTHTPLLLALFLAPLAGFSQPAGDDRGLSLAGWGIDEKDLDAFARQAAEAGFDELITWNTDPAALAGFVAACARHRIGVYSCIAPMSGLAGLWRKRYPDRPVPWQVMTGDEEAALKFVTAGENQYLIGYQFGGEPRLTHEVLTTRIICPGDANARELLESQIQAIAAVPGIRGLAFDGFGYQNYRRCHCERCEGLLADYREAHPDMPGQQAEVVFFRDMLVETLNELARYARAQKPDLRTCVHIWPVFAPEPLYGNRLDVDLCGQTAAWYTLWPVEKIAAYSRAISADATEFHPRQQGVGMLGYYDRPGRFPEKDAARVNLEIETMVQNGCRSIQVCGSIDAVRNAEIAAVFRKWFGD